MIFFPNGKTFLEIQIGSFHLAIAWYAILILSGAILAYYISQRYAKKKGYDKELLEDYFFTMLPVAIIGARLYYCFFEWEMYAHDPIRIFYVWEGGLAIHGGLIAGILYSFFFFRYRGVNLLRIGDCILPNVLIAQVIGRWGNFLNQEAYGEIVSADYFAHFPEFIKEQMYINGAYRMPMFLYEGIGNLIGFLLITFVFRKKFYRKRGDMAYAYITWYGIVRFFVEMFRTDALMFMGLRMAQVVSLLFVLIGVLGYVGVYDKLFHKYYPFKHEKPVVLFDADGTLIDTQALIFASFRHTFAKYKPGYTLSDEELYSFLGPTLMSTFAKYFPEEQVDELVAYYREHNHQYHDEYVKEMPHAKEVLTYLKEEGYTVGVVSNKLSDTVKQGLKCAQLDGLVEATLGFDECKVSKPDPTGLKMMLKKLCSPVDDVIYVGDAPSDILAAKNMCAYSIGYVQSHNKQGIIDAKPCRMIYDLRELKTIVKEDREWNEIVM